MAADPLLDAGAELVEWGPIGRAVRGGSWRRQAEPTLDRIEAALAEGRGADAAALVRHLVVEATEAHDVFSEWCIRLPEILLREGADPGRVDRIAAELRARAGSVDPEAGWLEFRALVDRGETDTRAIVDAWLSCHDRLLIMVGGWVDAAVEQLGEARLGELWEELLGEQIDAYARYDTRSSPWPHSFALLVQIALEGMHAHYGGPERRGEVDLIEHEDRIEMRFAPCGSGGRLRRDELFGVTSEPYPFAWSKRGVCHYCAHCCVLQQLEPIKRFGYPARVIEPPTEPGDECSWSVYRDPSLVPDSAYEEVGEKPPRRPGS